MEEKRYLKNEIKKQIDSYKRLSTILFTTYDFDIEFFENQLLPYLFDLKDKGLVTASKINEKLKFEGEKDGINLTVCYDHLVNLVQANINYKTIPIQDKCLHAKLIIIVGEKSDKKVATIMVLSGNISISSYSTNQEVCGIIDIEDKEIIDSIEKVSTEEDLYEALKGLNKVKNIIITGLDNQEENKIKEEFDKSNKIKVITPFIEKDVFTFFKEKDIEILFTNLRGIPNKADFANIIPEFNMYLYMGERAIHSKIYLLDEEKVIIGSHNFTYKAINSQNIEASLIFNNKDFYEKMNKKYKDLKKEKLTLENYNNEEIKELPPIIRNEKYISNAILDREREIIEITDKKITAEEVFLVEVGNYVLKDKIKLCKTKEGYEYDFSNNMDLNIKLQASKLFKLEVNEQKYIGIFYELQRIDKEKAYGTSSFFDMIETRLTGDYELDEDEDFEIREEYNNSIEGSNFKNKDEEIDEKYDTLKLFRYFKSIHKELNELQNIQYEGQRKKKIKEIFKINPNSIKVLLYNFLKLYGSEYEGKEKIDDKKVLYFLLSANELDILLEELSKLGVKNTKNIELEKVLSKLKEDTINRIENSIGENKTQERKETAKDILNIYLKFLRKDISLKEVKNNE